MAVFKYEALDRRGKKVAGKIASQSSLELENKLKRLNLTLIDFKVEQGGSSFFGLGGGSIKNKDMIMFCVHMSELDKAGVSVIDSLVDMRDTVENPSMKNVLADVVEFIKGGDSFSNALRRKKDVFDDLFCGLVEAGEETGNISESFNHLAEHIKWNSDFKRKIKKAMTYPIVLIVMMIGIISLMMGFVVPQLIDFIKKQGFELPAHTVALIKTSEFFENNWPYLVVGVPLLFILFVVFYKTSYSFRYSMDKFFLKIPVIGSVITKINIARFVKFFSITFNSGLGILESLEVSQKVVSNEVLKESIGNVALLISEGSTVTGAFELVGTFPMLVIRMFNVGEESGNMTRSLENINFFYEREINDAVDALVGLIQPTLMFVLGGTLLWIITAVFGPIYGSFGDMKF